MKRVLSAAVLTFGAATQKLLKPVDELPLAFEPFDVGSKRDQLG